MSRSEDFDSGVDANPWGVGTQRFKTPGAAKGWLTKYESKNSDADMWEHEVVSHTSGEGYVIRTRKSRKQLDYEKSHRPMFGEEWT